MPSRTYHLRSAMLALAVLSGCASGPSTPLNTDVPVEQRFARWVANFRETARAAGIDEATLNSALDGVQLRHRAVEADRAQPEFTRTLWDYLDAVVSPQRVAMGQQKLQELRPETEAATTSHGVPGPILMAVWGIESNYGGNYGDVPVIDALATLGFEGRREAWARGELLAALKILKQGDIDRARMIGSWAGAMGQTQFMPSSYLAYAVDADGDGRRDIWGSMADVLASTANYLAKSGWRADEPWGLEVQLPAGFDPARADPAVQQSSAQWAAEGVKAMGDAPWPALADASILLPAGARGPAFIVGRNYRTILRYNNSTSYALTVCLLAQRIGGGKGVQAAWPVDLRALTRAEMLALQTALNQRGFDSGTPDGQMGPATRKALRAFQRSVGLPEDGYPTADLLNRLQQGQ
ncbi:MAG: lytic murein transglycosylase [Leptothrix sp. (in: Bacteria)]|nr:lytic murein transglycosylase [Leptothrix sp. (in: b-proteobacteria)]